MGEETVEGKRTRNKCLNGINKFARPFDVFDGES